MKSHLQVHWEVPTNKNISSEDKINISTQEELLKKINNHVYFLNVFLSYF